MSVHCVVVSWLKEPGNLEHIAQLTAACESLRQIPGVSEVRFGPRANLGGVGSDEYANIRGTSRHAVDELHANSMKLTSRVGS